MEMEQTQNSFGSKLRYYREEKGLTQEELSNLTSISALYINKLETNNIMHPTYPIIEILSQSLGIDVKIFLEDGEEKIDMDAIK